MTYSDGVTPNITSISYDADNQRTGMTDGTGSSTWVYDSLHRLTSYTNGNGSQIQYAYNLRNEPTTITYPGSHNVTEGYDADGRWTSTEDWNSKTTTYAYDANSNLTSETMPTSGTNVVDAFTYNAGDEVTGISSNQGGTNIWGATYTRDNASQLTSDSSATTNQTNYKYTALNQTCYAGSGTSNACSSPPTSSQAFAFDSADNLTTFGGTQQKFKANDELCWTYSGTSANACNSTPSGGTTYAYDLRGNRTSAVPGSGSAICDTYDQADRLTEIQTGTGSSCTGPTTVGTYAYNGDGLRMSKTVSGTTTQETWDESGGLPLLVEDGSTYYVYGPGGSPLEQIGASTLWYHHDQIGSTRAITDSTGAVKATYTFDPYGNVKACTGATVTVSGSNVCTGTVTVSNPFTYDGQYRDDESNLYYLRARYYDPGTGQFLTADPAVGETMSPYAYVAGNPLNLVDPTGRLGSAAACVLVEIPFIGDIACALGVIAEIVTDAGATTLAVGSILALGAAPPGARNVTTCSDVAGQIAGGHAWTDRPRYWKRLRGYDTPEDLAGATEDAIQNGDVTWRDNKTGRTRYEHDGLTVWVDPSNPDGGTVFVTGEMANQPGDEDPIPYPGPEPPGEG